MSTMFLETINDDGCLTITLNRPEIHNAFNDELISLLTTRFNDFSGDESVRVVVIAGAGKSFCAGADLKWMKKMVDYSLEENIADSKKLAGLFHAINDCSVPVIGKVHGAALGGGVGIVAACDYVIASNNALFGFSEVRLGIIPAVISPFVMEKIGVSQARAYFLSGKRFDAKKAYELALVHEVVEPSELDSAVQTQVQEYLKAGPLAVAQAKSLIKNVTILGPVDCHEYTYEQIAKLRVSTEGQEGMNALLEKRKPNWIK